MRMRFHLMFALVLGSCLLAEAADIGACTSRQPFSLDINAAARTAEVSEPLTYDSAWSGDASSVVKIRINDVDFAEATGVGEKIWEPHRPGTYTITATTYQDGSIVGDVLSAEFEVVGRDLVNASISLPDGNPLYDGTQRTPRVEVVYQGETLVEGQDYTVSYDENISGVGKVVVTGMGRFHDEVEQAFKIVPAGVFSLDICSGTRVANPPEKITYDENWFSTAGAGYVRIMENGTRVAQENGRGEYAWTPAGTGLYTLLHRTYIDGYLQSDVYSATFFVGGGSLQQDGISVSVTPDTFQYDGSPKTPVVSVTHDGFTLKEGQDYSVVYRDNVEVGTGYAVVTGMGKYEDVVEKPFSIVETDGIYRVSAKQRYPWNGKVDVRFDSVGQQCAVSLVAKDLVGGTNVTIQTLFAEDGTSLNANGESVMPGSHHWIWDADADIAGDFDFANLSVRVNIEGSALVGAAKVLELSVDGYTGTETLADVPVLVRLSSAIEGFSYADFNDANGGDMVFCDETGGIVYPHEIDEWHTDGESLVWVKLPQMKKGTKFKMGCGGTVAASATLPKAAVWSDYAGVWHMNEDSGTAYDSTAHGLDAVPSCGTNGTAATLAQMVAYENGACGRARINSLKLDGRGNDRQNFMLVPSYDALGLGDSFAVAGWFKGEYWNDGTSWYPRLFSRKSVANTDDGWEICWRDAFVTISDDTNSVVEYDIPDISQEWVQLVVIYESDKCICFTNGVSCGEKSLSGAVSDNGGQLAFGNTATGSRWSFIGQYDEIRLLGGSLSADRIKADYDMIANTAFLGYGAAYSPLSPVDSDGFRLSVKHDGVRTSAGAESLTYSPLWDGGEGSTAMIAQDGTALWTGLSDEGDKAWTVSRNGTYVLTHTTSTDGAAGKVETATFVVSGKDEPFADGDIVAVGHSAAYDGEAHGIAVTVPDGASVRYSLNASGPFETENPSFKNVCDTTRVWFEVTKAGFIPYTNSAVIAISPRPVTLTSGTKTDFVYDGTAHELPVLAKSENSGEGFVAGEGITTSNWATVTTVAQGQVDNTFDYAPIEGTDLANYEIAVVTGKIAVVKGSVVPDGGGEEPGGGDVPDGGLSKFDADVVVYDGKGHTIDTNALVAAFNAAMVDAGETRFEYGYATDGAAATRQETGENLSSGADVAMGAEDVAEWREIAPAFTNAGEYVVWYRVTNPNYEDFVHAAKVTISPRPVTLTSGTKTDFVYDGTAHEFSVLIKSENPDAWFVAGEGITTSNWATVTTVAQGQVANTFSYEADENTDLANYEIAVVTGKIAVVAAPMPVGPTGAITAVGYTNVYDSAAHGVSVAATGLRTEPMVQYRASEADDWADASPMFSDV